MHRTSFAWRAPAQRVLAAFAVLAAIFALEPAAGWQHEARAQAMVTQMEKEGFGHCTNFQECVKVCPKGIQLDVIARMNRDFIMAQLKLTD